MGQHTIVCRRLRDVVNNALDTVDKIVIAKREKEYESFLETGCLRVDEFRSWWHETAELLDL